MGKDTAQSRSKGKKKWSSFRHNGIIFYHPYIPHNVPLIYNNNKIPLSPLAEEYATLYTKCINTCNTNTKFNRNFWKSWKPTLTDTRIVKFEHCDFSLIKQYLEEKKLLKESMSTEKKIQLTERKKTILNEFRKAYVDDVEQIIGNVIIEPPGIFIGRGSHPLIGTIKERIMPSDITINISKDAKIPDIYYLSTENKLVKMNTTWGDIIHDNTVEWVASWIDKVAGKRKYIWLSDTCTFKTTSDMNKFDTARKLKRKIGQIRTTIYELIQDGDIRKAQLGIAIYLIDNLALRVGNEKGLDEADTVGVTSLRVEHITLSKNNVLTLDFLGKDSMRYLNSLKIDELVYNKLTEFTKNKDVKDQLFNTITSCDINNWLQNFIKNLTAKTFRTYNASLVFQHKLRKLIKKYETDRPLSKEHEQDIIKQFDKANAEVAKLCNHQKAIPKSFTDRIGKLKTKIDELKLKRKRLQQKTKRTKPIIKKISKIKDNIDQLKDKIAEKTELKNISLTTSKINYIDPRIVFSFAKYFSIPLEKFYSTSLIKKFSWAENTSENFKF